MIKILDNFIENVQAEKAQITKKEELKSDSGISFENMFKTEMKKEDKADNFEINIEVNVNKNESQPQQAVKTENDSSKEVVEKKTKKTKDSENKFVSFINEKLIPEFKNNVANKDKKVAGVEQLMHSKTESKITDNSKNTKTIKLKLEDFETGIKDKLKTIVKDFRDGKIDSETASRLVLDTITLSKNKQLQGVDKKDIAKIEVKNDKTEKPEQKISFGNNSNTKNLNVENIQTQDKKVAKNDTEDRKNDIQNSDKKDSQKVSEKVKSIVSEILKERDSEPKEIKSEMKFDINDVKVSNFQTGKEKTSDVQKALNENKDFMFENIAKNTKIALTNSETKFSTMIRPEELGRVDFKFTIKDGKIDGRIILQNQEAADFFKANVAELRAVFQKSNVEMGNIDIALAGQGMTGWNGESGNDNSDSQNKVFTGESFYKIQKTFDENNASSLANYSRSSNSMVNIFI